jgi:hypothetical protein
LLYFSKAVGIVFCDFAFHGLLLSLYLIFAIFESVDVLVEKGTGLFPLFADSTVIDDHRAIVLIDNHR